MAPMKRSRWPSSRLTMPARRSPPFSSASMRAREAAVNAVSAPAKNADRTSDRMTMLAASQRLIWAGSSMIRALAPSGGELLRHKGGDIPGRDAARDEASPDAAGEDEGKRAG